MAVNRPEIGREYVVVGNESHHGMEAFSLCKVKSVGLSGQIRVEQDGNTWYVRPDELACKKKGINYSK